MSEQGIVYSQRLGPIRDDQWCCALTRFDLGEFVRAEPITSGLFGQNVFLTSTRGQFVFRGCPHADGDEIAATCLQERSGVLDHVPGGT